MGLDREITKNRVLKDIHLVLVYKHHKAIIFRVQICTTNREIGQPTLLTQSLCRVREVFNTGEKIRLTKTKRLLLGP